MIGSDTSPAAADRPPLDRVKLEAATRHVAAIKGFYVHLAVFVLVMLLLLAIDLATGSRRWVHWVFLGWGIGVLAHAFAVYGRAPRFVADWEKRKIKQLVERS